MLVILFIGTRGGREHVIASHKHISADVRTTSEALWHCPFDGYPVGHCFVFISHYHPPVSSDEDYGHGILLVRSEGNEALQLSGVLFTSSTAVRVPSRVNGGRSRRGHKKRVHNKRRGQVL